MNISTDDHPIYLDLAQITWDGDFFGGSLVRYDPAASGLAVTDDEAAKKLSITSFLAPPDGTRNRAWMRGELMFGVRGNHVVLMQSQEVRDRTLEEYLRVLLRGHSALAEGETLELTARTPAQSDQRIREAGVKRISLGGDFGTNSSAAHFVQALPPPETGAIATAARAGQGRVQTVTQSFDLPEALSSVVMNWFRAQRDRASALRDVNEGDLNFKLDVSMNQYLRGDEARQAEAALAVLGSVLRHAEDVDVQLKLATGDTLMGDQLRISSQESISVVDGHPVAAFVHDKMRQWLIDRQRNGQI